MNIRLTEQEVQHVNSLAQKHGGLTADLIIADAKKKRSPLHRHFQWDVEKAAMEHWRDVARSIIREVKVKFSVDNREVSTVAYVRDPSAGRRQGYVALASARDNEDDAAGIIASELARAEGILNRVLSIASAVGKEDEARQALRLVIGIKDEANRRRGAGSVKVERVAAGA